MPVLTPNTFLTAVFKAFDPSSVNKYILFTSSPLSTTEVYKSLQTSAFSLSPSLIPRVTLCMLSVIPIQTNNIFPPNSIPSIIIFNILNSDKLLVFIKSKLFHILFVFTRSDKQSWSVVSYYRRFSKIRTKIAYKRHFDSYAFRHTCAYHFIRKGGTMSQLQALLGHRGIDMTNEMYGEIIPKHIKKTTPYDF